MCSIQKHFTIRPGYPDFHDLPWEIPVLEWENHDTRLEQLPRGLSRHPVVFVNYNGNLYAIKELPAGVAQQEYEALKKMEALWLPAVTPVGYAQFTIKKRETSVIITEYLEQALPYRMLFMQSSLNRYREHLIGAMAGMLVQLHLGGIFWGDCSLSNTLFRRDAGTLQAYLVDAETSEVHPPRLAPMLRYHDLEIMEANLVTDLTNIAASGHLPQGFPISDTGDSIRRRYRDLWDEINREEIISSDESYHIQERIRALNNLGFSVKDVEMQPVENGNKLRFRVFVTDRNFHRDQLLSLTGLEAEEMQARQMMNEIQEIKAWLSQQNNRNMFLSAAAYYWLENVFQPIASQLRQLTQEGNSLAELYCQVLEHKWFLSERSRHDVGHQAAVEDYLRNIAHSDSSGSQVG
jgi:DNA-binding transcriptional MerR regulator